MVTRFVWTLLLCGAPLYAENFADRLLEASAQAAAARPADPIETLLLAERIYYLSHESGQQDRIADLLASLFENATHGEVRAEIGYFLTQHYRQLGRYDEVSQLVKSLGYVPEWQVLGPLAPKRDVDLKALFKAKSVRGLNRDVRFRTIRAWGAGDYYAEGIGHYGYFSGNLAVFPNQLAGALYTTWFYVPKKGTVRLGLGWDNGLRAWVNNTVVFDGRRNQTPHPDQETIFVNAKKGWHRLTLLIDSAAEDSNLGFYARLTSENGEPLKTKADHKRGVPRRKVSTVKGEPSLFVLAKERSDYALASILLIKEQEQNETYGTARNLLAASYAKEPRQVVVDKLVSLTEDTNTQWQLLATFLKKAEGLDRAWTLTQLGQITLSQERFWQARDYAKQALAADEEYWPAAVLMNNVYSQLGISGEALRNTLDLVKTYPGVPWLMMDLSDLYASMEFQEEAEKQTDAILEIRHANDKFAERKIELLKRKGDTEALDRFFESLLRDSPYSLRTMAGYVNFLAANDRFDKAEQLLAGRLEQLPENPALLEAMGELKMKSGRSGALPYLEKALTLKPQNPTLEKMIQLSKSERKAFYEPYRIAEAPDVYIREVSPVVINIDNKVRKVSPNGQSSLYHQLEYEILAEQGIKELPGYAFSYAPLREKAEIIKAEIVRGDKVIHITRFGRSRISDPAYRMYYDLVSYQIPFTSLEVGDIVRLEYRVDDFTSANIYGDYFGDQQYFSNRYPTKRLSYTAILPADRKIHYHVEKMNPEFKQTTDENNVIYTWSLDGVSPYETEAMMPGLQGYMPYVALSTFNDWQSMASWYKDLIDEQLDLDLETKKIVAELTEGVTDRMEIVKRIHEYVVTNTRYVALEFGIHGYKPYEMNQVSTRQFGDCKDKAGLIVSMLREAGVPANIAIVRTADRGYVHTFPAMLAYFNHAIAHVPEFDLYLDGTAEFSGVDELPVMDQGALTLIVDEDGGGKLTKIPIYDNTRETHEIQLEVAGNGDAAINGELSYTGSITPEVRQYLSISTRLGQDLQELMADSLPGLAVTQADREGRRINEPITLRFSGNSNRIIQKSNGELKLPLSILNNQLTQVYAPNANRQFPIDFGVPKTKSVSMTIAPPEGYMPDDLPEPLSLSDENFSVNISFERKGTDRISVNYQLAFKASRVEPGDYPALRDMMQAHDRVLDQSIRFIAR
ncbi:MAG: DUF3857 domain-containing protein [Acidobacteriota bacterium]|nr:DUF3857 domain-containing protein [Acidobacteriota bacterium]